MSSGHDHEGEGAARLGWLTRVASKLSYANVTATLALFVSLGGASYAAVTLPTGSVGRKQLQPGAVGLNAVNFPLGSTASVNSTPQPLTKGGCNGGGSPGNVAPPCTPERKGGATPGREVQLHASSTGRLSVFAIAGLKDEEAPGTTAHITLRLLVDRQPITEAQVSIGGGQALQAPIQALVPTSRGSHAAGLQISAEYSSPGPGDVVVTMSSLIVNASPGLSP
jgi:hypothetical protein